MHGHHHLGTAIGAWLFTEEYVSKKVKIWSDEILTLSSIAAYYPRSAYCAFVHGVVPKWNCVMQTIELISGFFILTFGGSITSAFHPCSNWPGSFL